MLAIKNLFKDMKNQSINGLDICVEKGSSLSIECSNEIGKLIFELILGKELPTRGEILIEGIPPQKFMKEKNGSIGVILKEDPLYENMSIEGYLRFFHELFSKGVDYKATMLKFGLLDIGNTKIHKLNYSEKRRVSLAREMLKKPTLLLLQEPILNMDRGGAKLVMEGIQELSNGGTALLITSVYLKDAILVGDKAYRLDEDGCREIDNKEEKAKEEKSLTVDNKSTYTLEKISAKIEDKILLFDPKEIDYIESEEGSSYLFIRGERFPCNLSLTELEERLVCFGFFRSHRSYLVNLQRVREVVTWTRNSYSLNLEDKVKSSIPLSKGRLEELKTILKL
ncbi:ABC transporter [Anaerocolumna cellulosilytica]|uniref:ABC transporter n=1 Tax=Anaerocolumna cellulosilytica TaxID=433286 RepID=A0A6S6R6E0_9FIRM|nr:LytTR family transcriptional regulator DNA-binding domain-containing protein [Anaerocolumna cellulosilytica]MBB5195908.1 ABC-2 type transport system ATP-binding protein [Anaerocolumna cellulosilytica]BCJ96919.1 ABC transporter [Anaerocolumna cellulosilytica]